MMGALVGLGGRRWVQRRLATVAREPHRYSTISVLSSDRTDWYRPNPIRMRHTMSAQPGIPPSTHLDLPHMIAGVPWSHGRHFATKAAEQDEEGSETAVRDRAERWRQRLRPENDELTGKALTKQYLNLSKSRLTGLVVTTAALGYVMASPSPMEWSGLLWTSLGTAFVAGGANSLNQWMEARNDSQMGRTRLRPIPTGNLSLLHGMTFGVTSGLIGTALLAAQVNGLTAALGATNLLLYTQVYGPLKFRTPWNTWVGAVVGAIPPMMGWTAVTGTLDAGAWTLGVVLFAWQIPHFMAMAWLCRYDYSLAGYQMHSVVDPKNAAELSERYAYLLIPACLALPVLDITGWLFGISSLIVNGAYVYGSQNFKREQNDQHARKLFRFSLAYLPLLSILMILDRRAQKKQKEEEEEARRLQ